MGFCLRSGGEGNLDANPCCWRLEAISLPDPASSEHPSNDLPERRDYEERERERHRERERAEREQREREREGGIGRVGIEIEMEMEMEMKMEIAIARARKLKTPIPNLSPFSSRRIKAQGLILTSCNFS